MAKHKRLKPIRDYMFDKGEMIEHMFSSIPIVEVRNMVPMKLQGMPLHELKAECLIELLEMSDREIMNILEGKKTRDSSSSESEGGGVVVISDDERRIKKERRSDRRHTLRKDNSDGSSTERSSNSKKKNKRKSKEKEDSKSRKKIKVESKQPAPSRSKDVPTSREIPKKKKGAKIHEKLKPPAEDVVILDDISSEEDSAVVGGAKEGGAKESGKKTGEKSLLELLELEMRARAIRSLLKKEEETQAQRRLNEYKDEPDDLIPVEIAPPQVDLLSDSDEESKHEEHIAQPSTSNCLQLEVEGNALSSKDAGVLELLLGIEKEESSDVVEVIEVEDVSIDSTPANPVESTVINTKELETSKDAVIIEETESRASKDGSANCEVTIKIEKDNDEPNQSCIVKTTPSSVQLSCVAKSPPESNAVEMHASKHSFTTQAEILKLKDISGEELSPLSGKGKSNLLVLDGKSSAQLDDDTAPHVVIKEEPTSEDDIVIALSGADLKENDENQASETGLNIEKISEEIDIKEASDGALEVSNVKSRGSSILSELSFSPVGSKKPQSSLGYDYHSNFEEDILDYDYDPGGENPVSTKEKNMHLEDVSGHMKKIEEEKVLLSFSEDEESDCIQSTQLGVLSQDKDGTTLDENNDLLMSEQCYNDSIGSPSKENNFLVRDALGSCKFVSQKSTVESQEYNEAGEPLDLADVEVSEHGEIKIDGSINTMESTSHKSEELFHKNNSDESAKIHTIMPTPDTIEKALDLADREDSNSVQSTELKTWNEVKNDDASEKPSPQDQCVSSYIANESEEHNHFLVDDALDSLKAISPRLAIESQEHNETKSISTRMDTEGTTLNHYHPQKTPNSYFFDEGLDSKGSASVLIDGRQLDFTVNNAVDYSDTSNRPKKTILAEELCGSITTIQEGSVDEVVPMECKIAQGLSDNEDHHFLVDAALDSLVANSNTTPVNQEPNEFSLVIEDDVSQKRASPVSNQNDRIREAGTGRGDGMSGITETSSGNYDGHFLCEEPIGLLNSDSEITNQEPFCFNVDTEKAVLGEEDVTVPEETPKGMVESDFVYLEAQSSSCVNVDSKGQVELTLTSTNIHSCSENETTAFVGFNSIEIQKTIQITNGQAVRQTVLLSGISRESLNMDCIVVSSEEEVELDEVPSNQQRLDESMSCSSKNNPFTENSFSPACDDSQISYHSRLQRQSVHQDSLGNKSGDSRCDILIWSDEHTFHGTKCLEKIKSNEGDPSLKSASCWRTMESNSEATQRLSTVVEQRGNDEELNEIDIEGVMGDEKQPPNKTHGSKKTTSSLVVSSDLVESLIEEAPSCIISDNKPTFYKTESLEANSPSHEAPCLSPAPSSTRKASSLEPLKSSVTLEVRADKLEAEKKDSEVIEIDCEDSGSSFSGPVGTTQETKRFVETRSNREHPCISFAPVPSTKASVLELSEFSLQNKEQVSGASGDVERTPNENTSQPRPSSVPPFTSTPSCLESIPPLILKTSNHSGTENANTEVIEIIDEDSGGSSSEKEQIPNVVKCLDDTTQQQEAFPCASSPLTTRTSTFEPTRSMDVLEKGNSVLENSVKDKESYAVRNSGERKSCDALNHLEAIETPHGTCLSSPVPSYTTKTSCLEPARSPPLLGLQTVQSEAGINHSEVIEIDDEDSTCRSSKKEQITHEASTPQDPTLQLFDSSRNKESSGVSKGPERQSYDLLEETASPHQTSLSLPVPSSTTNISSLEPTKSPLLLGSLTNQSATGNHNSEVVEICDDDSGGICHEDDDVSNKAKCLEEITPHQGNSCLILAPSSDTGGALVIETETTSLHGTSLSMPVSSSTTNTSSLDSTQYLLVLGLQTNKSRTGNDSAEVIEIDDHDSEGMCCKEEQIPNKVTCLEDTTLQQGDASPSSVPSVIIRTSILESTQPLSSLPKKIDNLKKGNRNSEVDVTNEENSDVCKSEERQSCDGFNHLEEIETPHGTSFSSPVSSSTTKISNLDPTQSPLVLELQIDKSATGTYNCEVIEINDDDSDGICSEKDNVSNMEKCLEETTPHQGNTCLAPAPSFDTGALVIDAETNRILVNENNDCEVIDVNDEDTEDSSSDDDDNSDTSSEDSEQSNDTVHSISDDEVPNECELHQGDLGSFGKVAKETECIARDIGVKPNEQSVILSKGLPETVTATVPEEIVNAIIDISDSASEENPQAGLRLKHASTELESVFCNKPDQCNFVVCRSSLAQKVGTDATGNLSSNLHSEPDSVSHSNLSHNPQAIKQVHGLGANECQGNHAVDQPCKEQTPPEKELEEGEIEGSDDAVETMEDEVCRNSKLLKSLETSKARSRPHNKRSITTTTDSDDSVDSIRRSRLKRRLKLRKRKMLSKRDDIQRAQKNKDTSKNQDKLLENDPPQIAINMLKQTTGSMVTSGTIVIVDDDEKIVEAITKKMPPEILELDDSDEVKTNWTARWLESSHVKKVVTTSKILTNARKKMKMKLKVKEVPEIETSLPLAEAPKLIGSVEEYHRLVKEGVITSSSKDKRAAENREATASSTTVEKGDENVDGANLAKENERTSDPGIPVDQPRDKLDSPVKKADEREVKSKTTINAPLADPSVLDSILESPTAQLLLDVDLSVVAGKPDSLVEKDIVLSGNNESNLINMQKLPDVEAERLITEVQESNPQPSITEMNAAEDNGNKSSEPANLDPMSSSIKSFYEMMNPNQVIGIDLYSKSLTDIPIPPVVSKKNISECSTSVLNQPAELPLGGESFSIATASYAVGVTNQSIIGPSNSACDRIEENTNNTLESKNLIAASELDPQLPPRNELEEGEIEESDHEMLSPANIPNNVWVINRSPKLQPNCTIPSTANVRDIRLDNSISTQPSGSSFSPAFNPNSVNRIVQVADYDNRCTHNPIAGNSAVGSLPNLLSSQIVGQSTGIVQCTNLAGSPSLVHPAHIGTTLSHSTLSSVVTPSYTVPQGQATTFTANDALQNQAYSGVHAAVPLMNPIQAAAAGISNHYQYGVPTSSSAHPPMSVNVNSTLHMYDPYYSWVYRQGLSGSLNSSCGYGSAAPEPSQDAGTIYKQWGEYYKKLMEACQDSAARAGVSNMFEPPNVVETKGYSWVFERPNQAPADTQNQETLNVVPKDVEPVRNQVPNGEWNYRYGLKGLLNEHFVTPGAAPASTADSNTPQAVPRDGLRGRRRAGRGRRKQKKK